ncbi:MAG: hypothetical protein JWN62_3668 [Acidimicrobiales bacterium]|nr:hypothetical protein [Acidimicrobiales bacterium]
MSAESPFDGYIAALSDQGAKVVRQLEQPAGDDDIFAVAAAAGRVPPDLDEVWRLHNGTRPWADIRDGELCPPFHLVNTAGAIERRMDRRDPENRWSDFFDWSTEFDGLGVCLPILEFDSLSLMIDVTDRSGQLLLFDSYKSDGIVLRTGLTVEAWFQLQLQFLHDGWIEVVDGWIRFPERWPSATMPDVESRLFGLETWNPGGPGVPGDRE